MSTATLDETVVERLVNSEQIAELQRLTEPATLGDLMRLGCAETKQSIGSWGQGSNACALTTAAFGLAALRAK